MIVIITDKLMCLWAVLMYSIPLFLCVYINKDFSYKDKNNLNNVLSCGIKCKVNIKSYKYYISEIKKYF